ncbi:MAG: sigma-70 family RNA polymerase sigma factor [Myxococcota bacterium]
MSDPGPDDATLLEAWRAGDGSAATELLRRHFIAVYRFFTANLSASGRGADADDLTQRTFEACIKRRDAVAGDFRGYLFGVARNQLYDEWRRRKGGAAVQSPSEAAIRDVRTSPSAAVARLDEQRLFIGIVETLPDEYRSVVELYFWEDRPVADIARQLGVPVGTVKSRLFRGRAMLRDGLLCSGAPEELRSLALARLHAAESDRNG